MVSRSDDLYYAPHNKLPSTSLRANAPGSIHPYKAPTYPSKSRMRIYNSPTSVHLFQPQSHAPEARLRNMSHSAQNFYKPTTRIMAT